jgi:hypothetical protein
LVTRSRWKGVYKKSKRYLRCGRCDKRIFYNGSLSRFYKTSFEEQNDVMFIEVIDLGEKSFGEGIGKTNWSHKIWIILLL